MGVGQGTQVCSGLGRGLPVPAPRYLVGRCLGPLGAALLGFLCEPRGSGIPDTFLPRAKSLSSAERGPHLALSSLCGLCPSSPVLAPQQHWLSVVRSPVQLTVRSRVVSGPPSWPWLRSCCRMCALSRTPAPGTWIWAPSGRWTSWSVSHPLRSPSSRLWPTCGAQVLGVQGPETGCKWPSWWWRRLSNDYSSPFIS